jgi:pimeloyl-ACP methyl ester carboxylesterase
VTGSVTAPSSEAGPAEGRRAAVETPAYLGVDGQDLFALVTEPRAAARDVGVVVLAGGGWFATCGRNGCWTRLARQLAEQGYPSVRFDHHGVGESTGFLSTYRLGHPFVAEALAAVDLLRAHGARRIVLVGTCFGARTALACVDHLDDLAGMVLFTCPMVDHDKGQRIVVEPVATFVRRAARWQAWRNLRDGQKRRLYLHLVVEKGRRLLRRTQATVTRGPDPNVVSPAVLDSLASAARRGIPTALVFGRGDSEWHEHTTAQPVLAEHGVTPDSSVTVSLHDGVLHGFASAAAQDVMIDEVTAWLATHASRPG